MGKVLMAMAGLGGLFGGGLTLDKLPAPSTATEVPAAAATQHAALDSVLHKVLPDAKITAKRYFKLGQKLGYQPVVKQIDNLALENKATRLEMPARRPGYDLVDGWRVKGDQGLAVVMESGDAAHPLVGYYALTLPR